MFDVQHTIAMLKDEAWWQKEGGDDITSQLMNTAVEVIRSQKEQIEKLTTITKKLNDLAERKSVETAKMVLAEVRTAWDTTHYNEEFEERLDTIENQYTNRRWKNEQINE